MSTKRSSVVVPNWNGKGFLAACLDSLKAQTLAPHIIVVENGSTDGSLEFLQKNYPEVEVIAEPKNLGFAGGVNVGIKRSMQLGLEFVALFNNDAVADKNWLKNLVAALEKNPQAGIADCKLLGMDKKYIDSTGDGFSSWGLPFPRGHGETDLDKYDAHTNIFAASGGASLYRIKMFEEIGLFDEDFFAYYEDVDLSFRAQLAGWKILYVPAAEAYHKTGATSSKIKGFTTYQTMKNQPLLLSKNVPRKFLWSMGPRFLLAHFLFFVSAAARGQGWPALKGDAAATYLLFKKAPDRRQIQKNKKVSDEYISSIMTRDLPPGATKLINLRNVFWKLTRKGNK